MSLFARVVTEAKKPAWTKWRLVRYKAHESELVTANGRALIGRVVYTDKSPGKVYGALKTYSLSIFEGDARVYHKSWRTRPISWVRKLARKKLAELPVAESDRVSLYSLITEVVAGAGAGAEGYEARRQKMRDAYDALLKAKPKKAKNGLKLRGKTLYDGKTPVMKIEGGRWRHGGVLTPGSGYWVVDVATNKSLNKSPFSYAKGAVEWAREHWRRSKL